MKTKEDNKVGFWSAKAVELSKLLREKQSAITVIETAATNAAADALLDNGDSAPPDVAAAASLEKARQDIKTLSLGLQGAMTRRRDAIIDDRRARAEALRKRAYAADLERNVIEQKSKTLIEKLAALNEVDYTEAILSSVPAGVASQGSYLVPKIEKLRSEFRQLMDEAGNLDQPLQGEIPSSLREVDFETAVTPDDAALAILSREVLNVPSPLDVIAWFAAVERMNPRIAGHSDRHIRIQWTNAGAIDEAASYIQITSLVTSQAGVYTGRPVAHLGSDIFYSRPRQAGGWM